MSELAAKQIQQLADLFEQNPKAKAEMLALLGISSLETENPTPKPVQSTSGGSSTSNDLNAGKVKNNNDEYQADKAKLDSIPKAPVESASDILAFLPDHCLPRHVTEEDNAFVPNLNGMYAALHDMNDLTARKFRATRAHQGFNPFVSTFYFTFAANLQVARCQHYAKQLTYNHDTTALDNFLSRFPPEKFPIPGPLLPYFKALTTYRVQNALHERVSPRFPAQYHKTESGKTWFHDSHCTQIFPYLPAVAQICSDAVTAQLNDTNGSAERVFTKPWPLEWKNTSNTSNADLIKAGSFLGVSYPEAALNNYNEDIIRMIVNPATYRTPLYPDTTAKTAKTFLRGIKFPTAPTGQTNLLRVYLMIEDTAWVKNIVKYMTEFSSLWTGSGTLADCSLDGPAFGAYQFTYDQLPTGHSALTKPLPIAFQSQGLFDLSGVTHSTQGSPEPVVERLAAITQIHGRLCSNHWDGKNTPNNARRFGNVWDIRPIYGPSSSVYFYDNCDEYIEASMKDAYKK